MSLWLYHILAKQNFISNMLYEFMATEIVYTYVIAAIVVTMIIILHVIYCRTMALEAYVSGCLQATLSKLMLS